MTPCQRLKQTLFDLLDADVDSVGKKHIEHHLKECPECHDFFASIKHQRDCLKALKTIRTQDHFLLLLRERIRRERAGKRSLRPSFSDFPLRWATVLGLVILLSAAAVWFSDRRLKSRMVVDTSPKTVPASDRPANPAANPIYYVIDEFQGTNPQPVSKPEPAKPAPTDTSKRTTASFRELRSRLTPVSF